MQIVADYLTANPPPAASESTQGIVELATIAETTTGTDTTRAVTPAGVTALAATPTSGLNAALQGLYATATDPDGAPLTDWRVRVVVNPATGEIEDIITEGA